MRCFCMICTEDPVYIARHNLTSEQVEAHVMDNLEEACELAQRKHGIEVSNWLGDW